MGQLCVQIKRYYIKCACVKDKYTSWIYGGLGIYKNSKKFGSFLNMAKWTDYLGLVKRVLYVLYCKFSLPIPKPPYLRSTVLFTEFKYL